MSKKLLDGSEFLISADLPVKENNVLKHHQLDMRNVSSLSYQELVDRINIDAGLTIRKSSGTIRIGDCDGMTVKRIALCGGEVCILELSAC